MATSSQLGRMDRLTDKKAQLDLREALLKDHSAINFCKWVGRLGPHAHNLQHQLCASIQIYVKLYDCAFYTYILVYTCICILVRPKGCLK